LGLPGQELEIIAAHGQADLLGIVRALLPTSVHMSSAEARRLETAGTAARARVAAARAAIEGGGDPLGMALTALRTATERRVSGAIYTPPAIVRAMTGWAADNGQPARVVDPGCGSGRFLLAAARSFPAAQLVGVDNDPCALLVLRANAAVLDCTARLQIHCADYRQARLPGINDQTLFIGNPPYVRHHGIAAAQKAWFSATANRYGLKASQLAGLHVHFYLRTRQLARAGDYGAFVTSAEWLDVNYGRILRELLTDALGVTGVHILAAESLPFDAMTTGAITTFHVGRREGNMTMREVRSLAELGRLDKGSPIERDTARSAGKWSILVRPGRPIASGHVELGELFHVHRGQVTGANDVWVSGSYRGKLPVTVLKPAVTRARELFAAGPELTNIAGLRCVIDLPRNLDTFSCGERDWIEAFQQWARLRGTDQGYIARHRPVWWAVDLREPAPILCTYMARRTPAFVENPQRAHHINIAHGLYPREPMAAGTLRAITGFLHANVALDEGRTYAGGLVKFEPGEVGRLLIPNPATFDVAA
jgi:adenine-specific DNA-methyltransferase